MTIPPPPSAPEEEGLPFDPRTVLLGLRRRWPIPAVAIVISVSLAIAVGKLMGSAVYQSETVLMYNPIVDDEDATEAPTLYTMLNLVKTEPNLTAVRERLQLACTLPALAGSCDINARNNTNLMEIRARWDTPEQAAEIANALREAFIENQLEGRRSKAREQAADLEAHLQTVSANLQQAEEKLQEFTIANRVVDLDKEAQWLLEEQTSLEILRQEEMTRKRSIELQAQELDPIIENIKKRVAEEKAQSDASMEEISTLHGRVERLGEKITEDKQYRANMAALVEKEASLARAEKLLRDGIISKVEFDRVKADYERQKALTVDTDEITSWRAEMEKLDKEILPETSADSTNAGRLLYDLMLRSFDIQLEEVVAAEKVRSVEEALERVRAKLGRLPELQRTCAALERDVQLLEDEKKNLTEMRARFQRIAESAESAFAIVSSAVPAVWPVSSTGRKLAMMTALMGTMLGFGVIVLLELLDTTIKTDNELSLKLKIPALGVLPRVRAGAIPFPGRRNDDRARPGSEDSALLEEFQRIARRIRRVVPHKGARILVVAATHGEGVTNTVLNLAACYGRQDERVLIIDTNVRAAKPPAGKKAPGHNRLLEWALDVYDAPRGLGDYLSYTADDISEIRYPTKISGVECVPSTNQAILPQLLAAGRMGELLDLVSARFSLILLDGAPILECGDSEAIARWVDGALLVVRSRATSAGKAREAIERMQALGVPVIGAVLNLATKPYYREVIRQKEAEATA